MPKGCKIHLRNVSAQRFTSGGGTVHYNIEIDRCAQIMTVREKRRRVVATMPLGMLAKMIMDRYYASLVRERTAERRRRRLVRRGALAFRGLEA